MAKKRRRKTKQKVLYHRLALVVIVFLMLLYLLYGLGNRIYNQIFNSEDNNTTNTSGEVKKIENKDNKKIVVIDAGHGGYDVGSQAQDGTYEKEVTLKIALATGAYIESKRDDVMVLYIREDDDYYWTNDEKTDLYYRVNTAIENDASLFMSIHLNSHEENEEIRGHETWASLTSQENETFAYEVDAQLDAIGYTECRGVKNEVDSPLLVLHYNTVPSVLVELGYINSVNDFAYINSKKGKEEIAKALGESMLSTLDKIAQ